MRLVKNVLLMSLLSIAFTSVSSLVSPAAHAQEVGANDKVVYKKRTLVDFSDVSIQGELRKPEGDFYGSRKRTRFQKLIRVRPNFVPEILSSTDNL